MNKVVIVMPTYNEAENIKKMVGELFVNEFPKIKEASMHLLVVDDNSPDGTGKLVKEQMKKYKNLHILEGQKQGLGWAYVRGMRYAMDKLKADAVIEMDADFQHDPVYIKDMVQAFLNGAEYVIGARYIKGGSIPKGWQIHRKLVSYFGNLFARIVLLRPDLHDVTTGFRLTKVKGLLEKIKLEKLMELKRFAYKVDLLYKTVKLAKSIKEVPIHFAERKMENSKFSLKEMQATYKVIIKIRLEESASFIKFAVVGLVGFVINSFFLNFFISINFAEFLSWALSTELAIISNFTLNNVWTFKSSQIEGFTNIFNKFLQFNLTSTGAILIQSVLGTLGVKLLGIESRTILLFFIVVFAVMPYNYAMYNIFIWKRWNLKKIFSRKNA